MQHISINCLSLLPNAPQFFSKKLSTFTQTGRPNSLKRGDARLKIHYPSKKQQEVFMNLNELVEKLKYLRKFGGNVLCIGADKDTGPIVDNFFTGHSSIFVDLATSSTAAKELLLEQLSYDLVFCTPQTEESNSELELMDMVFEAHPYANFVLASDCKAYEELNLEPQQIYLNFGTLEGIIAKLRV